jgi:uncharacterized membrane protein
VIRTLLRVISAVGWLLICGCASQMESANQSASQAGETVGGAVRVPNSFTEGVAKGIAGQSSQPNPYNR